MGIFNKSEKDDDFGKLYNYLSLKKYFYIKKTRKYYVGEGAFYSAILSVILNDKINEKVINKEFDIDSYV